jgi:hypothetical protein
VDDHAHRGERIHALRSRGTRRPGDLLLECGGGREISATKRLTFSFGEAANLLIEKLEGGQQKVNVQLLMPKSQKHPVTAPPAVSTETVSDEIGLLRVTMLPGAIGIDVAKYIDRGIAALPPTPAQSGRERRA